jgi:hypothetical protein
MSPQHLQNLFDNNYHAFKLANLFSRRMSPQHLQNLFNNNYHAFKLANLLMSSRALFWRGLASCLSSETAPLSGTRGSGTRIRAL